jgi:hypothetical protein
MNGNALIRILATFGLLIASLWVAFDIFTSGSNAVARFYMYAMGVCGVYGLLNARKAFFLLLFLTGYLDFFKRFMIFDETPSRADLYYVLGIAPATLAGICGNILYQHFTGKLPARPGLGKLIFGTLLIAGALLFLSLTSDSNSYRSLGDSVNGVVYMLLLFVIPVIFRTPEQLRDMLKMLVVFYVPAVAYMLVHYFNRGIFDWEMDYLKSGLTIEIRQLQERVFRPFGTMNSAANACMVFACIFGVCFSGLWTTPGKDGRTAPFPLRYPLIVALGLAMYATYSRTGWVFAVVMVLAMPLLKRRALTLAGYCAVFGLFTLVVFSASWLLKHRVLNEMSEDLLHGNRTAEQSQATNVATLNARLEGYEALVTVPQAWTPFGLRLSGYTESAVRSKITTHDMVTTLLLNYGYIPLIVAGLFVLYNLWKLHRYVFSETEPLARAVGVTGLAVGLVLCSGAFTNGAQFNTYPVNYFIWFGFGITLSMRMYGMERDASLVVDEGAVSPPWARNQVRVVTGRPAALPAPAAVKAPA